MAAELSTKLTLDGTEHNDALRGAARELSKYKREVTATDKELQKLKRQSQTATGALSAFSQSFKTNNMQGMLISASSAAKMFTKSMMGVAGIATAGLSLGSWLSNAVTEGKQLAQEGEGIRLAFERLNKPGLLDNLRQSTHNTVTDIELMKQAVKFNDFNLSVEQLGTYLAFAQQKAKDTGESVDYLVNSIVTGLGRQSPQILDNLGISASEIKKQMKQGGDMTTAVSEIIKKKMSEAGDYIETAAERAKKKEVELQNAYEELGRTFGPLTEAAGDFFHNIELWAINALNALRPVINALTQAGAAQNYKDNINGGGFTDRINNNLRNAKDKKAVYTQQLANINKAVNKARENVQKAEKGGMGGIEIYRTRLKALEQIRDEYIKTAEQIMNPPKDVAKQTESDDKKTTKKSGKTKPNYKENSIGWIEEQIKNLQDKIKLQVDPAAITKLKEEISDFKKMKEALENPLGTGFLPDIPDEYKQLTENISKVIDAYNIGLVGHDKAKELVEGFNSEITSKGLQPIKVTLETPARKEVDEVTNAINEVIRSYDIGEIGYEKAKELIDSLNDRLASQGLRPINVHLDTTVVREANEIMDRIADVFASYNLGIIGHDKAKELIDGLNSELESNGVRPVEYKIDSDAVRDAKQIADKINDVLEQHDFGAIGTKQARELINKYNAELKAKGLKPIKAEIETDGLEKIKDINKYADDIAGGFTSIDGVVNNITSLTEALNEGANAWEVFMHVIGTSTSILKSVESVMTAVNTVTELLGHTTEATAAKNVAASAVEQTAAAQNTVAKQGEAVASATAEGAKMPFPMNIVAIAMGVAAVLSALAMITGFANGGVIGGSSFSGDKLLARVNSGEMILNGRQQSNLFKAIDNGNLGGGGVNGTVEFKIKARDLVGVLKNDNDKMNKIR